MYRGHTESLKHLEDGSYTILEHVHLFLDKTVLT